MGLDRIFVDSNELFPFSVMDLVLSLAEHRLIDFVWTDELLDEWERVIVREKWRDAASAKSVADTVRQFFDDSQIDPADYRDLPWPELPDPDDRVHAAAAIAGAVLLTRNLDDFPTPARISASTTARGQPSICCARRDRRLNSVPSSLTFVPLIAVVR